jgi:hypothetical protein
MFIISLIGPRGTATHPHSLCGVSIYSPLQQRSVASHDSLSFDSMSMSMTVLKLDAEPLRCMLGLLSVGVPHELTRLCLISRGCRNATGTGSGDSASRESPPDGSLSALRHMELCDTVSSRDACDGRTLGWNMSVCCGLGSVTRENATFVSICTT